MKTIRIIFSTFMLMLLSVAVFAQAGEFGDKVSDAGAISAADIEKKLDNQESADLKVEGEIVEVCQSKGCWMTVKTSGDETIRVTFKDYGFFVPKDAAGHQVVFEGIAKKEIVDVETLKHYAEDAGKSAEEIAAITEGEVRVTFEAAGVKIFEK